MNETVPESDIQDFWSEHPMILPGIDHRSASPEDIFDFVDRSIREKLPHLQAREEPLLARLLDYSAYRRKRVLEIGFGVGWLMNEFVEAGAIVSGIDLSHSHYRLSSYRFRDQEVDLRIASAENIPFPDETFDFVVAYGVLHHSSNDERCYAEVRRVLKPGGRALLMVYRKGGAKYWYQKLFKKGILRGRLVKHGFNLTRFLNSVTDAYSEDSPGAPMSRHYTRADLDRLFREFSRMTASITGTWDELSDIPAGKLPLSDWLVRGSFRAWLLELFGGFWIINLVR